MSDWKCYQLKNLGVIKTGKTPPSSCKDAFSNTGVPFVTPKDMNGVKTIFKTERYLSKIGLDSVKNYLVPKNSIAVSCIGSDMGKAYLLSEDSVTNQQINTLIVNNNHNFEFIYYKLSIMQDYLKSIAGGSATPILNKSHFSEIEIELPDLDTQNNFVEKLKYLDKKIQLNTQINQTLEQIAQALFKSWFVDFDPVRAKVQALSDGMSLEQAELAAMQAISGKTAEELTALSQTQPERYAELVETAKAFPCEMVEVDGVEVPKGWEIKPLGDLISFVKGKKPKAVSPNQEENMLPHILTSSLEGKYNEFCESNKLITVEYQNTIMLMDGSNSGRIAIGHNGVIGSTLAKINLDNNKLWAVIYQFLKHKEADIQANTTGTTIPHTDKNRVNNYLMTIPNDFLLDKFTELFDNSLLKIISNRNQIISLETIRDLLLPRLLNGEINV